MYKILVVDDEKAMLDGLKDNLEFEGYEVDQASEGLIAFEKVINNSYDLIILDVMMPGMNGFDVCKKLRGEGNLTPVILLTAKGEEIDKVLGLELGADDYITKPFSLRELLARVKAILRRVDKKMSADEIHSIGKIRVNFNSYTALIENKEVHLSHKEFEILKYLFDHNNNIVNRNELLKEVWGYNSKITTRTVDNFILKLRQKIETDPNNPKIIITVHGMGYKLIS